MAGREEGRGGERESYIKDAVGDRNALDISTALMFGISKLPHFCLLSWDLCVFFITLRVFFPPRSANVRGWFYSIKLTTRATASACFFSV